MARQHGGPQHRLPVGTAPRRAAAAVLTAVGRHGPVYRDELSRATGLSAATVNRQVAALISAGLTRERPDLVAGGVVGRPRVPVEVDTDRFGVLGVHIGRRRLTLAAADLGGRVLGGLELPRPPGGPASAVADLGTPLRRLADRWPDRVVLRTAVVVPGHRGGRDLPAVAEQAHRTLGGRGGVDTRHGLVVVPRLEAMVRADLARSGAGHPGRTLYVYARETVEAVLAEGAAPWPRIRPLGTVRHLPVGGGELCDCGSVGCLESAVGDGAVAAAAVRDGIVGEPSIDRVVGAANGGAAAARALLLRRGVALGRGVALLRDVLDPDRVVLLGQAFTDFPPALARFGATFAEASALDPLTPKVSPLGPGVQALAACAAALQPVYDDPLGAVRRRSGDPARVPAARAATG